jgi:hypothetical protein
MSAVAHQRGFEEIDAIIFEDTGQYLLGHHIHVKSLDDSLGIMILSLTGDQHHGQAKGVCVQFLVSIFLMYIYIRIDLGLSLTT